jgi:hypothetical protein
MTMAILPDNLLLPVIKYYADDNTSEQDFIAALGNLEQALKWAADIVRAVSLSSQGGALCQTYPLLDGEGELICGHWTEKGAEPCDLRSIDTSALEDHLHAAASTCETIRLSVLAGDASDSAIAKASINRT